MNNPDWIESLNSIQPIISVSNIMFTILSRHASKTSWHFQKITQNKQEFQEKEAMQVQTVVSLLCMENGVWQLCLFPLWKVGSDSSVSPLYGKWGLGNADFMYWDTPLPDWALCGAHLLCTAERTPKPGQDKGSLSSSASTLRHLKNSSLSIETEAQRQWHNNDRVTTDNKSEQTEQKLSN